MRSDIFHARSPNVYDEPRIMLVGGVSVTASAQSNKLGATARKAETAEAPTGS